jgi:hypothetical protein
MQPKTCTYTHVVLTVIAVLLGVIAFRPVAKPAGVYAQAQTPNLYVEPRTVMLRKPDGTAQVQGKVFIDLRTGDAWGFPTLSDAPYPVDMTKSQPPVSEPMYLGKFDLSNMVRAQ